MLPLTKEEKNHIINKGFIVYIKKNLFMMMKNAINSRSLSLYQEI